MKKELAERDERIESLEEQIGALNLVVTALFETLRAREGWDEDRFRAVLREVHERDGELDGRAEPQSLPASDG